MKKHIYFLALALLTVSCNQTEDLTENLGASLEGSSGTVSVSFKNTSGQDLVIAMVQGAASGEQVNQVEWLRFNPATKSGVWQMPVNPQSNKDLAPYILDVKKGATATVKVPQYGAAVGFRCLVADPAYKNNALQTVTPSGGSAIKYMAFPDLLTSNFLFDKFEAGLTEGTPGIWNITAVDFVAIPMQLASNGVKVGFRDGVTAAGLITELNNLGAPYSNGKTPYRFLAPANTTGTSTVLDKAILSELPKIDSTVTVHYGNYIFTKFKGAASKSGNTVTGSLSASYVNITAPGSPRSIAVNNVSSTTALQGTILGSTSANKADSLAQIELGAILSAAICRGVTAYPKLWGDITHITTNCAYPWNYYPPKMQSNAYSRVIHAYSIDGKNYGFPYDDYFSDEAGFNVVAGQEVTVTILPLKGAMKIKANGKLPKKTGCVAATVPTGINYPALSSSWGIGTVYVEGNLLQAGSNPLCMLSPDTIFVSFPSASNIKMGICQNSDSASALVFFNKGILAPSISITGLVYSPTRRTLSFGAATSWVGYTPPKAKAKKLPKKH